MSIAFLDPHASYLEIKDEIDAAYHQVMDSGTYILGEAVENFENDYAEYCNARHCIGIASGLDALLLSLRALDIGEGDEVIVPSHTFFATWLAVSQAGATPIAVEPDIATYNIDPARIEAAISPRTRAIIPVHLYGHPADLGSIVEIAKRHGLYVIEDAAQAHGAQYKGQRIGAHGDAVCWSFYPGKNLGAYGDGGAITTDNAKIAEKLSVLRNYGSHAKYQNEILGYNSRLDPLQAAMLQVKLRHINRWNEHRKTVAQLYSEILAETSLKLPNVPNWADPAWHLYVIRHPQRDALQDFLAQKGVGTLIHYPIPPHRQKAYALTDLAQKSFPIAEQCSREVLSLPMGPHLSVKDTHTVANHIIAFLDQNPK
ncbi:DegT/DnrJ/EryC1/StrS family aminotransferase [Thalassospira alkalitolerans]|uniref:Erythromycin biosynthesis sensory transduction protein eryC1 n=1 Tax=Thalassospira alkalitolerans TaxID=1293890 RepID=A0A1Y2LCK1_9PROT|nr:DegT/DnrJ/EryC1/StrS family aminotransferase [Thalassospira alkalitolerans]OSQ48363.1 erythromycin biosynthesis sensory transduction protein eryC1 [Thalassospira alkalitolerans]